MGAPIYTAVTEGAVAMTAAVKSVLGVKANAAFGILPTQVAVSFDGVTASAVPVLIEFCYCTWATNSPATNSTTVTPRQGGGRVIAHGVTAAKTWTSEPTALTVLDEWLLHPQAGAIIQIPLGDEYDCAVSEGFVVRITPAASVNVRVSLKWRRA